MLRGKTALAGALALALIGGGGTAAAQDRWYVSGSGTIGWLNKAEQVVANAPAPGSTLVIENEIVAGWGGQIALGRSFDRLRAEIEFGAQLNGSPSYSVMSPFIATLPQDADTDIFRMMANAYVDFGGKAAAIRPYLGAGIGAARVSILRINAIAAAPTAPPVRRVDFSDTGFAYQAIGGVSWRLSPRISAFAQYRWFDAGDAVGDDVRGEDVSIGVATHNADLGLRFEF